MKRRLLAILIVTIMLISMFPTVTFAADTTISTNGTYDIGDYGNDSIVTIDPNLTVTLTNSNDATYTNTRMVCGEGVILAINNINIDNYSNDNACTLSFIGSNNQLILEGDSFLHSSDYESGIKVESGTGLEILGTGAITVRGGGGAAGIGGGYESDSGTINISDGVISVYGGADSAAIGGGANASGGNITISGGTVIAEGAKNAEAAIGGGCNGSGGNITILGGAVTAIGGEDGAGIGGAGEGATITISGGTIVATSGRYGAGIGGSQNRSGGTITITGGAINAIGGTYDNQASGGAGIGGGYQGSGGDISIVDGQITATGGQGAAGIGGGYEGEGGNVTIVGGIVTAKGGASGGVDTVPYNGGAGIGGGCLGGGGTISIEGGIVYAQKGDPSIDDIGCGDGGSGGTLMISGDSSVFLKNGDCISPTTTHTLITFETIEDDQIYGIDVHNTWSAPVYAYINEDYIFDLSYDANGGSGLVPGTTTQYENTTVDVSDGSALMNGGLIFASWNIEPDGLGATYQADDGYTLNADAILYAMYEEPVNVTSIIINSESETAVVGDTLALTATIEPINATYSDVTWSIASGDSYATIDETFGVLSCNTAGLVTVRATATDGSDIYGEITITVHEFWGEGTAENPYLIKTSDDLSKLAELVNAGNDAYKSAYYVLDADIDLAAFDSWVPIGNSASKSFNGHFDGQGKKIKNLTITESDDTASSKACGLFGFAFGAELKNIAVEDVNIDVTLTSASSYGYVGTVVGYAWNTTVEKSYATGMVTTSIAGADKTGGLVGSLSGSSIMDSFNLATVSAVSLAGGIVSYGDSSSSIGTSYNFAPVTATTSGQIIGNKVSCTVTDCYTITGTDANATVLTKEQGRVQSSYTGLDFGNDWQIGQSAGYPYPQITGNTYSTQPVTGITVIGDGGATSVVRGETLQMCVEISPDNAFEKDIVWSVENGTGEATIDADGVLTGSAVGTVIVKATAQDGGNNVGQAIITIDPIPVSNIAVTGEKGAEQVRFGQTLQMFTDVLPADAGTQTVTWSVESGTGEATIDQDGLLSAQSPGTVTVRATAQDGSEVYGEAVITIVMDAILVQNITIYSETEDFVVDESVQLFAEVLPVTAENRIVTWSITSGSSYATIDETSGVLSCNAVGTVTVRATAMDGSGVYGEKTITIYLFQGEGTEASPYLIINKKQLNEVRNNFSAYFRMKNDIVFTKDDFEEGGAFYNDGAGWEPIGADEEYPFNGSFDGNGYVISGLYQNISGGYAPYGGLFGYMNFGTIENLGMIDSDINASDCTYVTVGGIVGRINGGTIRGCYNTGSVSSSALSSGRAGGIVASLDDSTTMSDCFNTGMVESTSFGYRSNAGGIAATAFIPNIYNCYNTGKVESTCFGNNSYAGGILGYSCVGGTIDDCYNAGEIISDDSANLGGIIGKSDQSTVSDCYYLNRISKGIGNGTDTTVALSYAQLSQQVNFVGFDFSTTWTMQGNATYDFPELQEVYMAGTYISSISVASNSETVVKNETLQMSATVLPADADDLSYSWSVVNGTGEASIDQNGLLTGVESGSVSVWATANDGSVVYGEKTITIYPFQGEGTEASPFLITNITELDEVRNYLSAYFRMENDIEFTEADFEEGGAFYNGGEGFIPIGTSAAAFSGGFDGNGYAIGGLHQNVISNLDIYVGLFGYIRGGAVKNLGMENSVIQAETTSKVNMCEAGGIVGELCDGGIVDNCYNAGSISGGEAGGIVGQLGDATSKVSNCYNTGSISGSHVGGIAGWTNGVIIDCYNNSSVSGRIVGGIAGSHRGGSIINSHNSGIVNAESDDACYAGGISGDASANIRDCYNTGDVIADASSSDDSYAGGISGTLFSGFISNCCNTGSVYGASYCYTGGIAGDVSSGTISKCYNTGSVSGGSAGGIAGAVFGGTISNCYNTGGVSGGRAGGIAGKVYVGTISNCYNIGSVSGDDDAGGIAGIVDEGTISNCYYLNRISRDVGSGTDTAVAVTKEQLAQQETFVGFNFDMDWTMEGNTDYPYAELQAVAMCNIETSPDFAGGNGTPYDPYQITTAGQLNNVNNHVDACFILNNDIVFAPEDFAEGGEFYNNGTGFAPIGTEPLPFTGVFDGNGYMIKGLYQNITGSTTVYGGLFGYIKYGNVQDLGLEESNISVTSSTNISYAGGIAGYVYGGGTISNCYNTGSMSGDDAAGGIAGYVYVGTISNCYNMGSVSGDDAGGIVGYVGSSGTISKCYNTGSVSGDDDAGGIAGRVYDGTISNCYNMGSVSGSSAGGIGGHVYDGTISNCYNTGSIRSEYSCTGGIAGHVNDGTISNCYNIGNVSGSSAGGIAGIVDEGTISNCYYLNQISSGVGGGGDTAVAVTKEQLAQQETFVGFNFDTDWTMEDNANYPYAELQAVAMCNIETSPDFAGGNGMSYDPYQITTAGQLNNVNNHADACFILNNDIVFAPEDFGEGGAFYNNGTGFAPIGTESLPFAGVFDGNGYMIKGLYQNITGSTTVYGGLFGYIKYGTVQDLGLEESNISVTSSTNISYAGGIAGKVYDGTISNCYNMGSISGDNTGGIAGYAYGSTISNCYNMGSVSGSSAGGIAGIVDEGTISNCYNTGSVSSENSKAGGIAGVVYCGGTISNCYNIGSVSGNHDAGGIAGNLNGGTINNCYNIGSVSGNHDAGGIAGAVYFSSGTISNCYNMGSVSSENSYAGGIAGDVYDGTISNCYNIGSVSGSSAGGIAGDVYSGTISNCYNTGGVSGGKAGGIAGDVYDGTISNCYYLNRISRGVGSGTDTAVAVIKEQLAQQDTFIGFDFDTVWMMEGNETYVFPQLQTLPMVGTYVTSITVTSASDTVVKTETLQMGVTIMLEATDDKTVTWSVQNGTGEASIDESGLLTAIKAGTVTVKATANDGSCIVGTKEITITPLLVNSITVTSASDTVVKTETLQMSVSSILPELADDKSYTWSVENGTGEATIDGDGLLTGTIAGTVTVKVTANDGSGVIGSKGIMITPLLVSSITVTSTSDTVVKTETLQMSVSSILPELADDKSYTWSVENGTGEATIDGDGLLTGTIAGTVTVKVTANDGSDVIGSKGIMITPLLVSSITVTSTSDTVVKTETLQMNASILPADADDKRCTWLVENGTGEASIDEDGLLTGTKVGTVTVKATVGDGSGVVGTKEIMIMPLLVRSITIANTSNTVVETEMLQMYVLYILPAEADDKRYIWSVENGTGQASIDEDGVLTAIKVGTVTVKATASDGSDVVGSKVVTVTPMLVSSVTLSSNAESITIFDTMTLTATVEPENATHPDATWSTSDESIVTVDQSGNVVAVGIGNAIITVTTEDGNFTDTCAVTVLLPAIPTSIRATSESYNGIEVSWDAVDGADGYSIYRATKSSGPYKYLRLVSGTSFIDPELTTGQTHYYRVRSYSLNEGTRVYGIFAPAVAARPIPKAPTNFTITNKTYTSISLSWDAVTGATGYRVYRLGSGSSIFAKVADISATSYKDTSLKPGNTFTYKVVAYHTEGSTKIGGYQSNTASEQTLALPAIPTSIRASSESYNSIEVSWDAVTGANGYSIYYATKSSGPYKYLRLVTDTSFIDPGLITGQTHYYRVRSYTLDEDARFYGTFAPAVAARPVPKAPANFTITNKAYTTISLSWNAVTGATGYRLYRKGLTGNYAHVADISATSYINTGLKSGTTYTYKVAAYHTEGNTKIGGYQSNTASEQTLALPAIPTLIRASSASYNSIEVRWDAVDGADGYSIYRATKASGPYKYLRLVSGTSFINSSLTTGQTYYYRVRSYIMYGSKRIYGTFAPAVAARPIPQAPANLTAMDISNNGVTLGWDEVKGASGYRIYRQNPGSNTFTQIAIIDVASYRDINISTGVAYKYKVTAYCIFGTTKIGGYQSEPIQVQTF